MSELVEHEKTVEAPAHVVVPSRHDQAKAARGARLWTWVARITGLALLTAVLGFGLYLADANAGARAVRIELLVQLDEERAKVDALYEQLRSVGEDPVVDRSDAESTPGATGPTGPQGVPGSDGRPPTDLTIGTRTATTLVLASSTGADATLPAATSTQAGLMPASAVTDIADLKTAVSAAGAVRVYRKATVAYNSKTLTVIMVGMGTQAALDAATVAASTDGFSNLVVTISGLGAVKLSTVSVDVPSNANAGTGFTLVAPDPSGASALIDSNLAAMSVYNDGGAVQAV